MRIPRSLPALEALQWFGLLAGPLAYAVEHVLGLGATLARCNPAGFGLDPHPYQLAAMTVAAAIVVAGEAAALLVFVALRPVGQEDNPPPGRIRFLAAASLVLGPIFLTLVLLNGFGAVYDGPCRQA